MLPNALLDENQIAITYIQPRENFMVTGDGLIRPIHEEPEALLGFWGVNQLGSDMDA